MRAIRYVTTASFIALAVSGGGATWAKDQPKSPVQERLAQAKASVSSDPLKAAALFGQAVDMAQKAHDGPGEEAAADQIEEFIGELAQSDRAVGGGTQDASKPSSRAAMSALMKELDPKRNGMFVSAHALATELLRSAVARGDGSFVDETAAVLAAHEKTQKAGASASPLARFAEGLAAVKAGDDAKAVAALTTAFDVFAANDWLALALDASTELAALHLRTKDDAKATAVVARAAGLVSEESDFDAVQTWLANGGVRWKGASAAVLAPYDAIQAKQKAAAGAAGLAGGAGGKAGPDVSDVGRFLSKAGMDKAFVTVTRAKDGWSIQPAYRKAAATSPFEKGQRCWHDGGVTLVTYDASIALYMVDLEGRMGQPGDRSRPSPTRAFYWLAPGERYSVTKGGAVTVVGK